HVRGLDEAAVEAVSDGAAVYVTLFKRDAIMRIVGGVAQQVLDVPRAVIAVRGATLYAASYKTGDVVALGPSGKRTLAQHLVRPTALAADDRAVYVYTERDQRVTRIDLATGARDVLGEQLSNSDELVVDGDSI